MHPLKWYRRNTELGDTYSGLGGKTIRPRQSSARGSPRQPG